MNEKWSRKLGNREVPSASWLKKMSLIVAPYPSATTIWHLPMDKNSFVGAKGPTNHMLRGPGGILPPCALDNRHVDLCPGCGPCCGCSPSQPWLGAPGEHRLSPSPTDEEAFVEVQVSSKEVGVLEQQQKNAFGHIREGKRNSMTLSTSPPPQGGAPQCQVRLSRPVIAPVG